MNKLDSKCIREVVLHWTDTMCRGNSFGLYDKTDALAFYSDLELAKQRLAKEFGIKTKEDRMREQLPAK